MTIALHFSNEKLLKKIYNLMEYYGFDTPDILMKYLILKAHRNVVWDVEEEELD